MEYFKLLNLKKEPFSNSPDPNFFYGTKQHVDCLQKLEIAIRLKRGLNIVTGDVGTGKTTLCRQLIQKINQSPDGIEMHLILDPDFSSPIEFLDTVAKMFGVSGLEENDSERLLKEKIKKSLFYQGVEEKKNVVLIIDEGQKMPDFCLEIIREFLNYETNQYKLLQTVIFAQLEFEDKIKKRVNFIDRINLNINLTPLNFKDTVNMIHFRLRMAGGGEQSSKIFCFSSIIAIYISTRGYPRKIINLCSGITLAMIIRNKTKAGWFLTRSVKLESIKKKRSVSVRLALAFSMAIVMLAIYSVSDGSYIRTIKETFNRPNSLKVTENKISSIKMRLKNNLLDAPVKVAINSSNTNIKKEVKNFASAAIRAVKYPDLLGTIKVRRNETISKMIRIIYGAYRVKYLKAISTANPHIKDLSNVQEGYIVNFPSISIPNTTSFLTKVQVEVMQTKDFKEAYNFIRDYSKKDPSVRIITQWTVDDDFIFSIYLKDHFIDIKSANNKIAMLPESVSKKASVIENLPKDTLIFSEWY